MWDHQMIILEMPPLHGILDFPKDAPNPVMKGASSELVKRPMATKATAMTRDVSELKQARDALLDA